MGVPQRRQFEFDNHRVPNRIQERPDATKNQAIKASIVAVQDDIMNFLEQNANQPAVGGKRQRTGNHRPPFHRGKRAPFLRERNQQRCQGDRWGCAKETCKTLGTQRIPNAANPETTAPPTRKRKTYSSIIDLPGANTYLQDR